jgi:hypothetical protein
VSSTSATAPYGRINGDRLDPEHRILAERRVVFQATTTLRLTGTTQAIEE